MKEPIWLTKSIVEAIHISQIRGTWRTVWSQRYKPLKSTIACPMNRWAYEQESDIVILAAAYGYGFAKNHCFVDSNKRVAFMTMYTFLNLNGYEINATEPQVVDLKLGVADGSNTEEQLITWLRMHVLPDDDDKN